MGKVVGAVVLLLLAAWGCSSVDQMLRPAHYAQLRAEEAAERERRDRLSAEAEAAELAEERAQAVSDQREREAEDEVNDAALAMFSARADYPSESTFEAVTAYNERLAASIRRWERAQRARHGDDWREVYLGQNKLSFCGLNGAPRRECLEAPLDYSRIPTVENSMLPLRGLYPAAVEAHADLAPENVEPVEQAEVETASG